MSHYSGWRFCSTRRTQPWSRWPSPSRPCLLSATWTSASFGERWTITHVWKSYVSKEGKAFVVAWVASSVTNSLHTGDSGNAQQAHHGAAAQGRAAWRRPHQGLRQQRAAQVQEAWQQKLPEHLPPFCHTPPLKHTLLYWGRRPQEGFRCHQPDRPGWIIKHEYYGELKSCIFRHLSFSPKTERWLWCSYLQWRNLSRPSWSSTTFSCLKPVISGLYW